MNTNRLIWIGFLLFIALITGCAMPGQNAMTEEGGVAKGVVTCGQTTMTGHSSGSYTSNTLCSNDLPNLRANAVSDGNSQCNTFCNNMGCTPHTTPKQLRGNASCTTRGNTSYGVGTTGPFSCRCTNP